MLLTAELVMTWNPCSRYPLKRLCAIYGEGLTPLELSKREDIPAEDRLWTLLREEVMPARELRLLACLWAERVLPIFERSRSQDGRPRAAIEAARRYADGQIGEDELRAARAAAWAAAGDAAWDAAGAAARAAARAAAWDAAGAAAWDAAGDAARAAARDDVEAVLLRLGRQEKA